ETIMRTVDDDAAVVDTICQLLRILNPELHRADARALVQEATGRGAAPERLYATREAAERAGKCPKTIRDWVRTGRLQPINPDRRAGGFRFEEREVDRAIRGV